MNLQPLYDVKERLEHAAMAGTALLAEDFRLQRAAENLKVLAGASPVFAKIDGGLQKLFACPEEERGGQLLDLLALVDAVAYTQGSTGIRGELEPLSSMGTGTCQKLSYLQLHPLLEAITGTGGGRMSQIQEAWENHPEFFSDYRVIPALVRSLGESYSELADLKFQILQGQGKGIVPLLKEGFDPAGNKEMVLRARLISELVGAEENEWYLEQLEDAKKAVRKELIFALRHDASNGEKLVELCQTERGETKIMARRSLGRSNAPEMEEFMRTLAKKKPEEVLEYMVRADSETACQLTAELVSERLDSYRDLRELEQAGWEFFNSLPQVLEGKAGTAVCELYRKAAALEAFWAKDAPQIGNFKSKDLFILMGERVNGQSSLCELFPRVLARTLMYYDVPELCVLAQELFEQYGGMWAAPVLCAALRTQDGNTAYRQAEELLGVGKRKFGQQDREILRVVLCQLCWNEQKHGYAYRGMLIDPVIPGYRLMYGPLADDLDVRWYDLILEDGSIEMYSEHLFRADSPEICPKMGPCLYQWAMTKKVPLMTYCEGLLLCGWTKWKGFFVRMAELHGEIGYPILMHYLNKIPVSGKEKAAELREVDQLIQKKKIRSVGIWPQLQVSQDIEKWEQE